MRRDGRGGLGAPVARAGGKGFAAAAATIAAALVLGALLALGIARPEILGRLDPSWLVGGFAALLGAALVAVYAAASRKATAAPWRAGAKAVAVQLIRALLILLGVLGLLVLGASVVFR